MPQNVEGHHYAAPNELNAGRYSLRRKILLGFFSVLALLVVVGLVDLRPVAVGQ